MNDTLSVYLRDGTKLWANCETPTCAHGAPLDLWTMIDNPKVGDITFQQLKALNILCCGACGEKNVHLNIQPPHRRSL
jgi:hypothetical protein